MVIVWIMHCYLYMPLLRDFVILICSDKRYQPVELAYRWVGGPATDKCQVKCTLPDLRLLSFQTISSIFSRNRC